MRDGAERMEVVLDFGAACYGESAKVFVLSGMAKVPLSTRISTVPISNLGKAR